MALRTDVIYYHRRDVLGYRFLVLMWINSMYVLSNCVLRLQTGLKWPSGTYGLPKPVDGCPVSDGFQWKTGYRFHDTEDDGTENQHSDSFHLAGEFSDVGIRHEFCIKTTEDGGGG